MKLHRYGWGGMPGFISEIITVEPQGEKFVHRLGNGAELSVTAEELKTLRDRNVLKHGNSRYEYLEENT